MRVPGRPAGGRKGPLSPALPTEIDPPLRAAIALLAPALPEIHAAWRRAAARFASDAALGEALDGPARRLASGDLRGFAAGLREVAKELIDRGVDRADAVFALALYVEACLPHLARHAPGEWAMAAALARLFATGQHALGEAFEDSVRDALATGETAPVRSGGCETLTPREREVLALLADGLSMREAAARLGRSARTVQVHACNLMQKLGVHQRAQLVRFAIAHGVVPTPAAAQFAPPRPVPRGRSLIG